MKSSILIACILSMNAYAETVQINVECFDTKEFVEAITTKFNETPTLIGKSDKSSNTVIWFNKKTSSYTITTTVTELKKTCVIDSGSMLSPFDTQQKKSKSVQL